MNPENAVDQLLLPMQQKFVAGIKERSEVFP